MPAPTACASASATTDRVWTGDLARLGEPFFTTKTTGTGLGLAVVKAVARAHQGQLQLRSRPGRGTCATLILPLIPAAPLSAIQE